MKLSKRVKFLEAEVAELRNALVKALAADGKVAVLDELVLRGLTIINASGVPVLKLRADDDDAGVISVHNADGGGVVLIGVTPDGGIFSVATSDGLPRGVFYCEGDTGKICVITGSGSTTRLTGGESVAYDPDGVHRHMQGG